MAERHRPGTSTFDRIDALLANPELYELADAVPEPDSSAGGRPRHYPTYMWLLFDALLSVYGSAAVSRSSCRTRSSGHTCAPRCAPDSPTNPSAGSQPPRCGDTTTSIAGPRGSLAPRSCPSCVPSTDAAPPNRPGTSAYSMPRAPGLGPNPTCPGSSTPTERSSLPCSAPTPATPSSTRKLASSDRSAPNTMRRSTSKAPP